MRLFLLLLAVAATPARAQSDSSAVADDRSTWQPTARGVRLLGGYASASAFVNNNTSLSVSPEVGRFVRDGLALSLRVGVSGSRSSFTTVDLVDGVLREADVRATSVGASLGPAVTTYFGAAGAAVYPFVGASAFGYVLRSSSGEVGEARRASSYWGLSGGARAGVMVPVARNVGIEAQIIGSVYDLDPDVRGYVGFSAGISTFLY